MIKLIEDLGRAAIGAALLPVDLAADIVTLGGTATEKDETYTGKRLGQIGSALDEAVEGERP